MWGQLCLTLCNPMNCSLPVSSVHGIFQARILEWVAIPYCRGSSCPKDRTCIFCLYCPGRWIVYLLSTWGTYTRETQEVQIWSLGRKDPLELEMTTHSSILAWKIPWTEELGRLQSMGSSDNEDLFSHGQLREMIIEFRIEGWIGSSWLKKYICVCVE